MNLYYASALFFSTFLSVTVTLTAWRRRLAPGATGLALFALSNAAWAFAYAIRWCVAEPAAQRFWLNATYLGVIAGPFSIIVFTLQFTHRAHLLTRRNLFLLAIEPVLTLLLLLTDGMHGLFFGGFVSSGKIFNGGPWFWINVVYSYSAYLLMMGLIVWEYLRASHLYRRQTGSVLTGMLLPWVANIFTFAGLVPLTDLDITPFIFIISGLLFDFGLFRYRLLDIVPVAHDRLIENLPDGVIVLDIRERIVEMNPAARCMTGLSLKDISKPAESALAHWPKLKDAYRADSEMLVEMEVSQNPPRVIEARTMPLFDQVKTRNGSLILLRDITERKEFEEKLKQMGIHDALTGLYNRAYFEAELTRLEHGRRFPISLLMADVDNLKTINDQQGHAAGDAVLKRAAQVFTAAFRAEDVITRIGGDEFMVILPNTTADAAESALLRVQQVLREHNAAQSSLPFGISFGLSTAETSMSLTDAFKQADGNMYYDKRASHADLDMHSSGPRFGA